MLSKDKRLNLKTDFKWVASGKSVETKFLKLFIRSGNNILPRVGIALSSKQFKQAHERNRARRVVSASFESIYSQLPERINVIALPKSNVLEVKSTDVLADLEQALSKIKVIEF